MSMKKRCRNEVEQLHMFFQDWFTGAAAGDEASFARVGAVLADDFRLISPRGEEYDREGILQVIRAAHGSRPGGIEIWITDFEVRYAVDSLCVATYREWQRVDGQQTCRASTVVFRETLTTPNRVEWTHLHETWLPESATDLRSSDT